MMMMMTTGVPCRGPDSDVQHCSSTVLTLDLTANPPYRLPPGLKDSTFPDDDDDDDDDDGVKEGEETSYRHFQIRWKASL